MTGGETVRSLSRADVSVWLDPAPVEARAGEDLLSCLAASRATGVGPSLPAGPPDLADRHAASTFPDENPLRSAALARSARLANRMATHLAPVHAATGGGDGLVQFPAPPDLWDDAQALVALAAQLEAAAAAENLLMGLPYTSAGLVAAAELLFRGVSIAVGPVFSPMEYRRAEQAYQRALERRLDAGRSIAGLVSIVWIPVGVIDAYAAELLGRRPVEFRGGVGATVAELIYLESFSMLSHARWRRLRGAGAAHPRPAFCHLRANGDDDDFKRLVLPGSVLALSAEDIAAVSASARLEPAEPDETEARWAFAEAGRSGLRLGAMSQALRARYEVRSWLSWRARVGRQSDEELLNRPRAAG